MLKHIYLDYAATTPISKKAYNAMKPFLSGFGGNASSIHWHGQEAKQALAKARTEVAGILGARVHELIFTASGSESNNTALFGIAKAHNFKGHMCVSSIEHHSVLETARALEKMGVTVTYVPVTPDGMVIVDAVLNAICLDTFLVSVQYINNEVGTIQPIADIGLALQKLNRTREKRVYLHTDAIQAPGMAPLAIDSLHVDALSIASHKCYGPLGVAVLYIKNNTPFEPLIHGGAQERNRRAGTENIAGIVGFACALHDAEQKRERETKRLATVSRHLINEVCARIPNARATGHAEARSPHIASFCFPNFEGDALVARLSERGFSCSSGSACTTGSLAPSHVLLAMGLDPKIALGSVRVSLGRSTTKKDIDRLIKNIVQVVG